MVREIDEFIVSCEARGLSVRTCQWYRWHLEGFADWLGDRLLSTAALREYVASLRQAGWSKASLRGAARTLKVWCRWLHEEGHADADHGERLAMPRKEEHWPKVISVPDFERMLETCNPATLAGRRNRALVLFLADTGCRLGELPPMRWSHLIGGAALRVRGKGDKDRLVYLSPATVEALAAMRADHPDSDVVWWGQRGPMTENAIYLALRRLAKRAGCSGPTNPHSFRHFFGSQMLANGADLETIRRLMGHSDISTTRIYTHITDPVAQRKHAQHSPVARLRPTDNQKATY